MAVACSSRGVDRDIERLAREQQDKLREDIEGRGVPSPAEDDAALARARRKAPATLNKPADELTFVPAREDRDVVARLRALGTQSGLPSSATRGSESGAEGGKGTDGAQGAQSADAGLAERTVTLEEAWRASQRSGREFLSAQEDYLLAAIRLLQERHLWGPRLFNDTTAAFGATGDDGAFFPALDVVNTLRATRRLPSGGEVEARWVWNATEQLRDQATEGYRQSSELVLSGTIPLLRGAGAIAREDLIQAERDLVYQSRTFERFRRSYLVDIATDYFALLETRSTIANQVRQLQSLRNFHRATQARAAAGRLEAFQTAITENRLFTAESALEGLRDQYALQLDRFKVRLGLGLDDRFDVSDELPALPEPDQDIASATGVGLEFRLDLQNSKDRLDDSRRAVANARDGLLPDLDLRGEIGLPTDSDNRSPGVLPSADDARYSVGATLSLPLDRRVEELAVRSALIRLERATREHERLRDDVAVAVRGALRSVELSRFQLNLAEQQVEINRRRLRGQRLQEDTLDPQSIVDTENELLQAENDRDRAKTRLRTAVLNYLLQTDQLRVAREGTLRTLEGMGK
jgi:outer membrane protein TolC